MKLRLTALLGITLFFGIHTAWADGDPARGKILAYTCHGCHGISDYENAAPVYSVPKLGGQSTEYMISALKEYVDGDRVHPTMHAQAASNSEQDRADMAAFFHGNNPVNTQVLGTPPPAAQVCVACHGNNGVAISPIYPTLAGQHADYIEHALHAYKSGSRKNPIMSAQAELVKEEDIPAIAAFFAKQKTLCSTDEIRDNNGKCE